MRIANSTENEIILKIGNKVLKWGKENKENLLKSIYYIQGPIVI